MATAEDLRKELMEYMDEKELKYSVFDEEDNILRVGFSGLPGVQTVEVFVDFDEDGNEANSVHFIVKSFAKVAAESMPKVLIKLNEVNRQYRWLKFYERNNELWADSDAMVFPGSVGEECFVAILRAVEIIKVVFTDFGDLVLVTADVEAELSILADLLAKMMADGKDK